MVFLWNPTTFPCNVSPAEVGMSNERVDKPKELLALYDVSERLFNTLRSWFDVPIAVSLPLLDVDDGTEGFSEPAMVAALAMRKLQALRLLARPGVRTTTDVVVTMIQDLDRALSEAPIMHAKHSRSDPHLAEAVAAIRNGTTDEYLSQLRPRSAQSETLLFLVDHQMVKRAAVAVLEASPGTICIFA
jgi:hypothetical protein